MRYEFRQVAECNMCGSNRRRLLGMRLNGSQGLNPRRADGIAVAIKQCLDCDLIFPDPQPVPDDISDHYGLPPQSYWQEASHWHWSPDYFAAQIQNAKELLDFQPGMKALDIGVGLGKAMKSLAAAGFDAWGIEPLPLFRKKAIEMMALDPDRVTLATVEEADFPAETFDFISFGAVLEHLYDPSLAIERALKWLKPRGVIQAEVPSSRHLMARLINLYFRLRGTNFVTHTSPMHPPFHLYEFGLKSFERNGRRLGYEIGRSYVEVCQIRHAPSALHPLLRWWMEQTDTGMQLTVFIRKLGERGTSNR